MRRRRNFISPDVFPFTTASGTTYDSGDYAPALERALEAAGYDELRTEQERLRARQGDVTPESPGLLGDRSPRS